MRRVRHSARLSLVVAAEVSGSAPWPVGMRKARVEEQASGLALPASPPPSSDPDGSPNVKTSMTSLTKHRKTWATRLLERGPAGVATCEGRSEQRRLGCVVQCACAWRRRELAAEVL